jgi:hypothetical protein
MLYRFLILYGSLYAGFGVQSPYLPILLDNRHLRPETIALALAAAVDGCSSSSPAGGSFGCS